MRRPDRGRGGAGTWLGGLVLLLLLPGCSLFRKDVPTDPEVTAPEPVSSAPAPKPKSANETRKPAARTPAPAPAPAHADTAMTVVPEPPLPVEPAPAVTVRMTAEQRSARELQYQEDVDRAARALDVARACSLTIEQKEQLGSADRFLADARTAYGADDLTRAGTLAQKSRVLAEALRDAVAPR